jgi:hypothetical protein
MYCIRGSPILSSKVFLSVPKRNFVVCTHLIVHLYVVKDVEELLPCLDLVERNRHDVALGVVRNCLEVEAKDFQENNFKTMLRCMLKTGRLLLNSLETVI